MTIPILIGFELFKHGTLTQLIRTIDTSMIGFNRSALFYICIPTLFSIDWLPIGLELYIVLRLFEIIDPYVSMDMFGLLDLVEVLLNSSDAINIF